MLAPVAARIVLVCVLVGVVTPGIARAQVQPGAPGPYVFDVRGAMTKVPTSGEFFQSLPANTNVPGRAFGFDVGAHLLRSTLGAARLGFGANLMVARGSIGPPDVSARVTTLAPQVSFNFGTADGWSYLSGGYGLASVSTTVSGEPDSVTSTGTVGAINYGGGARWFVNRHVATSFDVRFHRLGASTSAGTPAATSFALSVGVSLR